MSISLPVHPSPSPPGPDLIADIRSLADRIKGEVRTVRHDRMLYATDASIYQVEPIGVVIPRNIDDVRETVRFARKTPGGRQLALLPRGGGTSLAGQAVNAALIIDFSVHCNRLLDVDTARLTARVEPGIVLDHLNAALAADGLLFGPDVATAAHANVGGMIGNNSAGARSVKYGRTVENLRALRVALADGREFILDEGAALRDPEVAALTQQVAGVVLPMADEIRRRFPKTLRRVGGYNLDLMLDQLERGLGMRASEFNRQSNVTAETLDDESLRHVNLAHLFCGAEGTLGVTTEATLDLVRLPRCTGLAIVAYPTLDAALHALNPILSTEPSAVELVDDVVIEMANRNAEYRRYVELLPRPEGRSPASVLYVEYATDDDEALRERFAALVSTCASDAVQYYTDRAQMADAWKLRKGGEPLLHAVPGRRKPITFIEDTAVAPQRLPDFVREFRTIVERHDTIAAYYAHASVGCLHIRPLIDPHDANDLKKMQHIAEEVTDLVVTYEGALSGEHGDGRVRSPLLERYYGPALCDAFRQIKQIFDPEHRMNPGNIVAPEPMLAHLRVQPHGRPVRVPDAIDTFYRYAPEGGFSEAVELCNGAGVCRKRQGGSMCPSYRALLDERHATRGRANALRLAITGQLSDTDRHDNGGPQWGDSETLRTLDLCLSCKACKTECPSNVDLARLKAEYLAQTYRSRGRAPLVSRLFGRVRMLNRLGAAMHPIANALMRISPISAMAKRVMGVHPRRSLPRFSQSLYHWMAEREAGRRADGPADGPTVVLLPDCFSVYNESHIGRAAVNVLETLGYHVVVPRLGCCGRSMISLGLLDDAIDTCTQTAEALLTCVTGTDAVAVVGLEPSCVSAIRDDWLDLKLRVDRDRLAGLAEKTLLIEEFIDQEWASHPITPVLKPLRTVAGGQSPSRVIFHGHCHQKALWGAESSAALLRRIAGSELDVLDSGCCGMAGSFGYMHHRYDLSMHIGELSVFGPFRDSPDAIGLATGTSCRHQIHDATGIATRHPIELFETCLDRAAMQR